MVVDDGLKFAEAEYARLQRRIETCKNRIADNKAEIVRLKKLMTPWNAIIAAYGEPGAVSSNGSEPEPTRRRSPANGGKRAFPCKRKDCKDRPAFYTQGFLDRHMEQFHGVGA